MSDASSSEAPATARAASTERAARASARHPWRVVGIWAGAIVIALAVIVLLLGGALTSEGEMTHDPESYRGYDLIAERLPAEPGTESYGEEIILVRSQTLTVDDPAFRRKVEAVARAVEATGAARRVHTFFRDRDESLVSRDRDAAAVFVEMGPDPEGNIDRVVDVAQRADGRPFDVTITGEWTLDRDFLQLSEDDLREGELFFGLPASLVILLLVFGAVVAGLVPILLAIVAIIVALALTAIVGQAFDLSVFVVNMLSGMGLALGIDYSLFVLSRYREGRAVGRDKLDAIAAAGATSSRAVLFSGLAFVLAMFGMVLVPDTILRSLAVGAILVGIVAVLAAMTLLPAVLSLLGDHVNALRIPVVGRSASGEGIFWTRIVRAVMRRPALSLAASAALLLAAAAPVVDLHTGFAGMRTFPDRFPSKQGFLALEEEFGAGTVNAVEVVIDGDVRSPRLNAAIAELERRLANDPAFRAPTREEHPDVRLAIVEALPVGDSQEERAIEAVERLREVTVPAMFAGTGANVLVTGETAENVDYFALVERWLPIVFAFVLGLSFVLLMLAFRSLVLPIKAVLLNLLSVGAAYGLLVLVFQKGVGNELFGFRQVETIEAWVPLFLFSVLFGLSMDYHVFLLSRIRERYIETRDNAAAVAYGVGSTARLITGAALIIIAVFVGFARGDLVMFQQMGFGVAVSLLIDATIIRSVLLPAAMKLLGEWNWYLPRWLDRLPDFHVEGAR
jgi:putative drug exporter of the RND superfamily